MPHPVHVAAARRDSKLLRIRRLTLWISGGAAAVALGLGTLFAHALPGHARSAAPSTTSRWTATMTGGKTSAHHTAARAAGPSRPAHHRARVRPLAAPTHAPAPAPAPAAPVSSGGS